MLRACERGIHHPGRRPAVMAAVKATAARYVGLEAGLPGPDEAVHVVDGSFVADLVLRDRDPPATPVVELIGLRIGGDIDLAFQEWRGSLSLVRCRIEGDLNLAHAHVRGRVCVTGSEVRRFDFSQSVIEGE